MILKAVFFDLDNTLLLYSEQQFYHQYIGGLYANFADLMSIEEFPERMMTATKVMVANDGRQTNLELFISSFADGLLETDDQLMARFDSFYRTGFPQFKELMQPVPGLHELFQGLADQGLQLVIATNPMFPMVVQNMKLMWADLDTIDFALITAVENSSFCKPNPRYFEAICQQINIEPEACLMVGNDPLNDIIATRLGIKTCLATDCKRLSIDVSKSLAGTDRDDLPTPDYTGSILDLPAVVDELV